MLLLRRTPRSTLFPYTTLFRSSRAVQLQQKGATMTQQQQQAAMQEINQMQQALQAKKQQLDNQLYADNSKDRKSTRLNSSHVSISYAVFCLKKKTAGPSTQEAR